MIGQELFPNKNLIYNKKFSTIDIYNVYQWWFSFLINFSEIKLSDNKNINQSFLFFTPLKIIDPGNGKYQSN